MPIRVNTLVAINWFDPRDKEGKKRALGLVIGGPHPPPKELPGTGVSFNVELVYPENLAGQTKVIFFKDLMPLWQDVKKDQIWGLFPKIVLRFAREIDTARKKEGKFFSKVL